MARKNYRVKDGDVLEVAGSHRHVSTSDFLYPSNYKRMVGLRQGRNTAPENVDKVVIDQDFRLEPYQPAVIFDHNTRKKFINAGIIGEPVGLGTRKSDRQFDKNPTPFSLSPYDVAYAQSIGLVVSDDEPGYVTRERIYTWGLQQDPMFFDKYSAYLYLRNNGYIVLSGLQYGVDFTAYEDSVDSFIDPDEKDHSRFLIDVKDRSGMKHTEAMKGVNMANAIKKEYLVVTPQGNRNDSGHLTEVTDDVVVLKVGRGRGNDTKTYPLDALAMKRIENSRSYNYTEFELRERRR